MKKKIYCDWMYILFWLIFLYDLIFFYFILFFPVFSLYFHLTFTLVNIFIHLISIFRSVAQARIFSLSRCRNWECRGTENIFIFYSLFFILYYIFNLSFFIVYFSYLMMGVYFYFICEVWRNQIFDNLII